MKNTFLFIAILFSCQTKESNKTLEISAVEEEAVKNLVQGAFDDLWGGCDSTKILQYHTEDFVILEHGEIWDNERIKEYMKYMRGQLTFENRAKRVNRMEYIMVEKYGESIQVGYHNYAEFLKADSVVAREQWLESALVVKTKEGWRLKMMHSTRVNR